MNNFLKNSIRFSLIGLALFIVLFCLHATWINYHPFPELAQLNTALTKNNNIILFGDSVNKHYAKEDKDKRSIAKMLDTRLDKYQVSGISYFAYQADIYLEFIRYINRAKRTNDQIVIIPINLRSFSPEWDLRPTYQFTKEKYQLNGYPYWMNFNFKQYPIIKPTTFEQQPVFFNNKRIGTVADMETIFTSDKKLEISKNGLIYHYMQPISLKHRKLLSLQKIAEYHEKSNLKILLYITPIDYQLADSLSIAGFNKQVTENINTIKKSINKSTIKILDLSSLLESKHFDYAYLPNEHLNMYGKYQLVKELENLVEQSLDPPQPIN